MCCMTCRGGDLEPKPTNYMTERQDKFFIIKHVPAKVCRQCGEQYYNSATVRQIERILDNAQDSLLEVNMIHYDKAVATLALDLPA